MATRKLFRLREARELYSLADETYRAGLASQKMAARRARDLLAGELSSTEHNLAHPYFRGRTPDHLRSAITQLAREGHAVSHTRARQLNLMLRAHHAAAYLRFGVATDRLSHLSYSLNDGANAAVRSEADGSLLVHYSDRLYQFVEFFSMLTFVDFFDTKDLKTLRRRGVRVSRDEIRTALVRYALVQENLTNGGAYLVPREATRKKFLYTPGMMAGYAGHSFVLAHELAHRLVDEVDSAPRLADWLAEHSLTDTRSETTADAIAVALMRVFHPDTDAWLEAEGAVLALSALAAFETGSHARLPPVEPTIEERLRQLTPFCREPTSPRVNPARVAFLLKAASYGKAATNPGWGALHHLVQRKSIAVPGAVHQAIELARFGDLPLALGRADARLLLLRHQFTPLPPHFGPLAKVLDALALRPSDSAVSYTSRFCDLLGIESDGREDLMDPTCPIRYYDLIDWLLHSPLLAPMAEDSWNEGYGTAIYLAGAYAGGCTQAAEPPGPAPSPGPGQEPR